jgi:hypothetical protein
VLSARPMLRYYKEGQLLVAVSRLVSELVRGMLGFSRGELLLLEAGS